MDDWEVGTQNMDLVTGMTTKCELASHCVLFCSRFYQDPPGVLAFLSLLLSQSPVALHK
jgi:hypothetical protein